MALFVFCSCCFRLLLERTKESLDHTICIKIRNERSTWTWGQTVVPNDVPRVFDPLIAFGAKLQILVIIQLLVHIDRKCIVFCFCFVLFLAHACLLKKRQSSLCYNKMVKSKRNRSKIQKKGLFWRWNSKCQKIVKATPESQYSFSMQRKWFQRTTNIRKKTWF